MAEDKVIQITFSKLKIAYYISCKKDYIQIVDGDGTELLSKTCGTVNLPPVTTSYTNRAQVIFHTDNKIHYKGWRLTWREGKRKIKKISITFTHF